MKALHHVGEVARTVLHRDDVLNCREFFHEPWTEWHTGTLRMVVRHDRYVYCIGDRLIMREHVRRIRSHEVRDLDHHPVDPEPLSCNGQLDDMFRPNSTCTDDQRYALRHDVYAYLPSA